MGSRTFWGTNVLENATGKNSAYEGSGQKWTQEDRETLSSMSNEQQSQMQAAIESYRSGANQ
ncbi:hypothetical protein AB6D53_23840, partial [Vibrio splendidus]